jgi:hypothetical protein
MAVLRGRVMTLFGGSGTGQLGPLRDMAGAACSDAHGVRHAVHPEEPLELVDEKVIFTGPAQLARLGLVFLAENPYQRPELVPRLEITLCICFLRQAEARETAAHLASFNAGRASIDFEASGAASPVASGGSSVAASAFDLSEIERPTRDRGDV